MTDSFAILLVGDDGVDVLPPGRKVRAGVEGFRLGIEWGAVSAWSEVSVDRFVRVADGSAIPASPVRFVRGGATVGEVSFASIERRTDFCEYDVTATGPDREARVRTFPLLLLGMRDDAPVDEGRRA